MAAKGNGLPLKGIRVVDLSMVWAGPLCTGMLADMGAEVVKVEACPRPDPVRAQLWAENEPGRRPWERGWWLGLNRNKMDVTLDLAHPRGVAALLRLVAVADVVVENFSPRVLRNLNLTYDVLRTRKPDLVMASLSGFGQTGPYRDYVAYGIALEPAAGISAVTGYSPERPAVAGSIITDPLGGMMGAVAILTALAHRDATGEGQYIDLSEREVGTWAISDVVLEASRTGKEPVARGNDHDWKVPHGVFRCQGVDRWIAISVRDDAEWNGLCRAIGDAALASDARYATQRGRWRHRRAIVRRVEAWARQRTPDEAMRVLQTAGVPAGVVHTVKTINADPHLRARRYFRKFTHREAGTRLALGPVAHFKGTSQPLRWPGPSLGQHNNAVLGGLLGFTQPELRTMTAERVIGTEPLAFTRVPFPLQTSVERGAVEPPDPDYKRFLGIDG